MSIENIILNMAFLLNRIVPKKQNQVFFYSTPDYSDNTRAIYEEMKRKNLDKKYSIVWAVKDYKKYKKLLSEVIVVKHRTLNNLWHFCRSKYIFRTHSLWGNKYVKGKQKMCIAWHGMPLKKLVLPNEVIEPVDGDVLISTSPFFDGELINAMGIPKEVCKHTGLPRNDELFKNNGELRKMFPGFDKIIIWMPTFRKTTGYTNGIESELGIPCVTIEQLNILNNVLKKFNYLLILKLHPWSAEKLNNIILSNIKNLRDKDLNFDISLYRLLGQTDALITDYSSVYVDYLLVNNPICFVYDDIEEYRKTRGFAYEPIEEYMPGAQLHSFNEIIIWINSLSKPDPYIEKREKLKTLFFINPDEKSSDRVLHEMGIK